MKCTNGWTKRQMIANVKLRFKGQAMGENGTCEYLTKDGKQCVAGVFFPLEMLKKTRKEDLSENIRSFLQLHPKFKSFLPLEVGDLEEFQEFHDHCNTDELTTKDLVRWIEDHVE